MERIDLDFSQLEVAPNTPHAGYYAVISTSPGNTIDVINLGPEHATSKAKALPESTRTYFHVALQHMRANKTSDDFGALLGPMLQGDDPQRYASIRRSMMAIDPTHWPPDRRHWDKACQLDICICEYLAVAMPNDNTPEGELDSTIEQGLKDLKLDKQRVPHELLPTELLTSRRIGHVVLFLSDLLQIAKSRSLYQQYMPLVDLNSPTGQPIERGMLGVTITPEQWPTSDAIVHFLSEFEDELYEREHQLSTLAYEAYDRLNPAYVTAYIAAYPPFKAPFALVAQGSADAATFMARTNSHIELGQSRFIPDKSDMNDIHMPTGKIDGQLGPLPIQWLFDSVPNSSQLTKSHDKYFGTACDYVFMLLGTSSADFAQATHEYLDSQIRRPTGLTARALAAHRGMALFLEQFSWVCPYRADVVLGGNKSRFNVMACEDISRDLATGVTGSGDCEDSSFAIHNLAAMIVQGCRDLHDVRRQAWKQTDPMWNRIYQPLGLVGGWEHVGLDAMQRLLSHYAIGSCLGSVTASFPGDKDHAPATEIVDLDEAETLLETEPDHKHAQEIRRYLYDEKENRESKSEAHRWCVALPLVKVIRMIISGVQVEDALGSIRYDLDRAAIQRLEALFKLMPVVDLPNLTLEGTTPMDPFNVVGASHFLPANDPHAAELRRIGARMRTEAVRYRHKMQGRWTSRGGEQLDGGSYLHLPGNHKKRLGSQFYNRVLQLDVWIVGKLSGSLDMTTYTCHRGEGGSTWGVPVDLLLNPIVTEPVYLFSPTHRIPLDLRQRYNTVARELSQYLLPTARLGSVNSLTPIVSAPSAPLGVSTFARTLYFLRYDTPVQQKYFADYKNQLKKLLGDESLEFIELDYKPLSMAHKVHIFSTLLHSK